ncbi:MAG: Holliday junction resolvase RuvX [Clostridiales Family XIII bacterium]|jgi:putative Holliday junction resolvase|nr:Holliday junction resolvase RuvX [Clostridiales Family XIII bacterium]
MMKRLALDVGDATIGVAISDVLGITARGLFTLKRTNYRSDIQQIMETVKGEDAGAIVVGLPINLDGTDSVQTAKVRDFATKLRNRMRSNAMADVEVILHDERFTTKIAERALIEADMSRAKRAKIIDSQAAVVILQSYLESLRLPNGRDKR